MIEISDNGAHEIARIRATSPDGESYVWVMTSDGRILSRASGTGDGYMIAACGLQRHLRTREALLRIAQIRGYRASSER